MAHERVAPQRVAQLARVEGFEHAGAVRGRALRCDAEVACLERALPTRVKGGVRRAAGLRVQDARVSHAVRELPAQRLAQPRGDDCIVDEQRHTANVRRLYHGERDAVRHPLRVRHLVMELDAQGRWCARARIEPRGIAERRPRHAAAAIVRAPVDGVAQAEEAPRGMLHLRERRAAAERHACVASGSKGRLG